MDPKVRPTRYKPMTLSTSSSGSTVFVKPRKQSCVPRGRLECLTLRNHSLIPPLRAGSHREKQNLSRWTNRTVSLTAVWTQVRSALTVSEWNRQTLPVGTAGTWKAMSDRGAELPGSSPVFYLYSICIPHMEQFEEALFHTFVNVLAQSLVSVPLSLVL